MNYLIADSGSTKTSWLMTDGRVRLETETLGMNPVRDSEEEMERIVQCLPTPLTIDGRGVGRVCFYGAGCIDPFRDAVRRVLRRRFEGAEISVESDLLGAAHALCGNKEGIVCILGTGSNSCLYDGHRIVQNTSPLGWILGDEGSGAVLGRRLVGDVLKGRMGKPLCKAFEEETGLTRTHIIDKVYREPMANRFLASLVPFLGRHREDAEVRALLVDEFRRFLSRNVAAYGRTDLEVSFVGGIANSYREELSEAIRLEGMKLGEILAKPIDRIEKYIVS